MDKALTDYMLLSQEEDFSKILTNPILDIAARFWDEDRYTAFRVCYKSMRILDDLVDNPKATAQALSKQEKKQLEQLMSQWIDGLTGNQPFDQLQVSLRKTMNVFEIPAWPWERLAKAMCYDLYHDGFPTLLMFQRYCEGAAIAPASVFMHLCGVRKQSDSFEPPRYDIRKEARALALFSYYVHIIRDVEKDLNDNLIYFPNDVLHHFKIPCDLAYLRKQITGPENKFRQLIRFYKNIADYFREKALGQLHSLGPRLEPRYQLSLQMIYTLYNQIFEKIEPETGYFQKNDKSL